MTIALNHKSATQTGYNIKHVPYFGDCQLQYLGNVHSVLFNRLV